MVSARRTNANIVQRAFDALNERDREAFTELHRDEVILHFGAEEIEGIEAVVEEEWAHLAAFPDLTLTPNAILTDDDIVGVRWTAEGTQEGEFKGIEPTGKSVNYSTMGMFRIESGEIAEVWLVADRLGLMQQLGVIESPSE